MDLRWTPTPADSTRSVAVLRHPTAGFIDILAGTAADAVDLSQYVSTCRQTAKDADVTFQYHTQLSGANQPVPGELLELKLNGQTLWVGIIDTVSSYNLSSGQHNLTIKAYSRDNTPAFKEVKRVTDLYPSGTPVTVIAEDVAAAVGLSGAEMALPLASVYTVHSNMQLANMAAWEMLRAVLLSSGYDPYVDARGVLKSISRDLARASDVLISADRIVSIGGSKASSPVTSVRILWLDPALCKVTQQDQSLASATITAGFFQRHQHQDIYFSDDHTQRASGTYMVVKQTANSGLLNVCTENYTQYTETSAAIDLETAWWAPHLALDGLAGIIAASYIPDNVAAFGGGITIPVGRLVEAVSQVGVMLIMMSIGTGVYEVRGQPFDFVHARNTTEATAAGVPDWMLKINDVENDFVMSEDHAQAFAARELIYAARSAMTYKVSVVDDARIECGDILELYDGSRLYVLDYSRDLTMGGSPTLDVTGFRA